MNSDNYETLEQFANKHGVDPDTLGFEGQAEAVRKLQKADAFETRGMEERAEAYRSEVIDALGGDRDTLADSSETAAGDDDGANSLSKDDVVDLLEDYDMDTLNSRLEIEKTQQTLKKKRQAFEARGMNRADELARELDALEAVKSEIVEADQQYTDLDTLASRATREGLVLTLTPSSGSDTLSSRQTGASSDNEVELDNLQACGVMQLNASRGRSS